MPNRKLKFIKKKFYLLVAIDLNISQMTKWEFGKFFRNRDVSICWLFLFIWNTGYFFMLKLNIFSRINRISGFGYLEAYIGYFFHDYTKYFVQGYTEYLLSGFGYIKAYIG